MQPLRLRFGHGEAVKFVSYLDMVRFWERVFRQAGIPLVYSRVFAPHPRISAAAPLAASIATEAIYYFRKQVSP